MTKLTVIPLDGGWMSPVFADDGKTLILIDCGLDRTVDELVTAAQKNGIDLDKLTYVIFTHQDGDHVEGYLPLKKQYPNIKLITSAIDKEQFEKRVKFDRQMKAEASAKTADGEEKERLNQIIANYEKKGPITVDIAVNDGDMYNWCGGVEFISTPGHLPGHVMVYLKENKTLITGDGMLASSGKLQMANPVYTVDMDEAARSIEKCMKYDINQIICYHGGTVTGDCKAAMEKVVSDYRASE